MAKLDKNAGESISTEALDFLSRATESSAPVARIKEGESVVLHFLYEVGDPTGWCILSGYFDQEEQRSYHFRDADVPSGIKLRDSYYAVALEEGSSKGVQVWELRKSVMKQLKGFYAEYGTLLGRGFRVRRKGSGMNNTEYIVTPRDPSPYPGKMKKDMKKSTDLLEDVVSLLCDETE